MMYIIAGLGNPGSKYAHTRHNVGFDTVEYLADYYGIDIETKKFQALVGQGVIEGNKVLLVKPQTYMNLSGESACMKCMFCVSEEFRQSPDERCKIHISCALLPFDFIFLLSVKFIFLFFHEFLDRFYICFQHFCDLLSGISLSNLLFYLLLQFF